LWNTLLSCFGRDRKGNIEEEIGRKEIIGDRKEKQIKNTVKI